jgi:hypothetical protein
MQVKPLLMQVVLAGAGVRGAARGSHLWHQGLAASLSSLQVALMRQQVLMLLLLAAGQALAAVLQGRRQHQQHPRIGPLQQLLVSLLVR